MSIKRVTSDAVTEPAPDLWSNCRVINDIAYISGLTARGADFESIEGNDEYAQTRVIFEKFRHLVEAAGGAMSDFVKLTIFVTDKDEYAREASHVGGVYREVMGAHYPAMALVQVAALLEPGAKVEIQALAVLGS